MSNETRALSGINETVGGAGIDASEFYGTTMPGHGFLDITRVGRNENSQNTQQFNPQEVIANFGQSSGLNQNFIKPETATRVFTA